MKKVIISIIIGFVIILLGFSFLNTAVNSDKEKLQQEQQIARENMERIEVFLPDLEEELQKDSKEGNWMAFYERYKDKVLVFKNAEVEGNHLASAHMKYISISQGGDGQRKLAHFYFDEDDKTEEVMNLPMQENVVVEGILQQPEQTYAKPLHIFIEHTKLIEHSAWENPLYLSIDMEPIFEETKAELLEKYSFVKNIEFKVERIGKEGTVLSSDNMDFITDVEPGTDAKEVLAYAEYAVRLLNENARKVDETIEPSTGDSYGGLYKYNYLSVMVRPEGVVEAQNKYYIFHTVSARVGNTIKLQKAYR